MYITFSKNTHLDYHKEFLEAYVCQIYAGDNTDIWTLQTLCTKASLCIVCTCLECLANIETCVVTILACLL